jgi:hypothetical protein
MRLAQSAGGHILQASRGGHPQESLHVINGPPQSVTRLMARGTDEHMVDGGASISGDQPAHVRVLLGDLESPYTNRMEQADGKGQDPTNPISDPTN